MAGFKEHYYAESKFGGFTDIDGTIRFYTRIHALLKPDMIVLDAGCGRGAHIDDPNDYRRNLHSLRGKCRKVVGLDIDPIGATNCFIDEFVQNNSYQWPLESNTFDLIYSDFVIEHLDDPNAFLKECYRVLKPGGYLCLRTTNRLGYVALISSLVPNRLHYRVLQRVQTSRNEAGVFPTFYRCNTPRAMRKRMTQNGFDCYVYAHEAEPSYLSFSRVAYHLGVAYQVWMPRFTGNTLMGFGHKRV